MAVYTAVSRARWASPVGISKLFSSTPKPKFSAINSTIYSYRSTDTQLTPGEQSRFPKFSWAPVDSSTPIRAPVPPFTYATALQKVKAAEAAWNSRNPSVVAAAYTPDSVWRNRDEFFIGRESIEAFLTRKWAKEHDYVLEKNLWCYQGNRISARFEYEWRDAAGQWYRTHGNEHWEFDEAGYMRHRDMSANDVKISEDERRLARNG